MILGIIGFVLNMLALYGWFTGNYVLVYIGGIFTIIVDLIGLYEGTNRTVLLSIVVPILVGLIFFDPSIVGACAGISFVSAIFFILGVLVMLFAAKSGSSNKKETGDFYIYGSDLKTQPVQEVEIDEEEYEDEEDDDFECNNCGAKVGADATECPKCGAEFVDEDEDEEESDDGEQDDKDDSIDEKYDDLIKLKKLLDKKIITQEEFNKEKKKVLNRK